jgi:hypothetical protein
MVFLSTGLREKAKEEASRARLEPDNARTPADLTRLFGLATHTPLG